MSEKKEQTSIEVIEDTFNVVNTLDTQAEHIERTRMQLLTDIRRGIWEGELPDEAKLMAAALMGNSVRQRFEYLKSIQERLDNREGNLVAWTSSKDEVVSYRDPGPNEMDTRWFLNIGLLPEDAKVDVRREFLPTPIIPVNKTIQIPVKGMMFHRQFEGDEDTPTWRHGWLSEQTEVMESSAILLPEIKESPDYVILLGEEEIETLRLQGMIGDGEHNKTLIRLALDELKQHA